MTKFYQISVLVLLTIISVFSILSYIKLYHMDSNTDPIYDLTLWQYENVSKIKNILDK